jgi:hypothetical protein
VLITPYFVFIHVRKTGGKFLKQVCRDQLPPEWFLPHPWDDHAGIRQIPPEYADLPVFAVIRNPWDWYVSWYHFTHQRDRWAADFEDPSDWRWAFDSGRASFKQAVSALCGEPIPRADRSGPASEPGWVAKARGHDRDLYSHWCHIVFQEGPVTGRIEVGRYERLTADFLAFLTRNAVPIPKEFATALVNAPPVNVSRHGPYREYYDADLRELVRRKCRDIIDTYGYEF